MVYRLSGFLILIVSSMLTGCSVESLQRTTYGALESHRHQKCLEQQESQGCDDQGKTYNEYTAERERHLEAE